MNGDISGIFAIFVRILDDQHGLAFEALTREYLQYDMADRVRMEEEFAQRHGSDFLASWRNWRSSHPMCTDQIKDQN